MAHRVTSLEFVKRRGALVVRAMGRSARGTKFHIRSVTLATQAKSKATQAKERAAAIDLLLHKVNGERR